MVIIYKKRKILNNALVACVAAIAMLCASPALASAEPVNEDMSYCSSRNDSEVNLDDCHLSTKDRAYFGKLIAIGGNFSFDEQDTLCLSLDDSVLRSGWNFTDEEVARVHSVVGTRVGTHSTSGLQPQVHAANGKVFFSHGDLVNSIGFGMTILAACEAGPAALAAILTAISTAMGGPVGTVIGGILSVVGVASLGTICGKGIWAAATGKGIWFGAQWKWPFIDCDYWG